MGLVRTQKVSARQTKHSHFQFTRNSPKRNSTMWSSLSAISSRRALHERMALNGQPRHSQNHTLNNPVIGVLYEVNQAAAVEEFFELFKPPWEHYEPCRPYDVVVATPHVIQAVHSTLVLLYGA